MCGCIHRQKSIKMNGLTSLSGGCTQCVLSDENKNNVNITLACLFLSILVSWKNVSTQLLFKIFWVLNNNLSTPSRRCTQSARKATVIQLHAGSSFTRSWRFANWYRRSLSDKKMTDLIEQFVIKVYGSVFSHSLGVRKNELVPATFVNRIFLNFAGNDDVKSFFCIVGTSWMGCGRVEWYWHMGMSYLTSLNPQLFKNIAYVGSFEHFSVQLFFTCILQLNQD